MSPAIRALLVLGLVTLAAAAVVFVAVLVLLIWYALSPGFNEYGDINECIGCPHSGEYCRGCRYNPEYWDHTTYTGPSRRELKRLRKERRENEPRDM